MKSGLKWYFEITILVKRVLQFFRTLRLIQYIRHSPAKALTDRIILSILYIYKNLAKLRFLQERTFFKKYADAGMFLKLLTCRIAIPFKRKNLLKCYR